MHCPECDAELSPRREFCPQCGAPTRRGLRETHASDRAEPELQRSRRRLFVGGAALLFGAAILGNAFLIDAADVASDEPRRGPAVVEAQQLYEEYRDDFEAADERYRNRELVVSGEFARIAPDGNGHPDLRLATSDPDRQWSADLIPVAHEPATRLRRGQRVTVSCQRMATWGEVRWLQNCALEAEPEGGAPPPEPEDGASAR